MNTIDYNINKVIIPWKGFGSDGHITQPDLVIKNFIKRKVYNNLCNVDYKSIFRGDKIIKLDIHCSITRNNNKIIRSDGNFNNFNNISEDILKNSCLHLNHYRIQSLDWFKKVKMTRGDVLTENSEYVRDLNYFKGYDRNDLLDDELSKKIY